MFFPLFLFLLLVGCKKVAEKTSDRPSHPVSGDCPRRSGEDHLFPRKGLDIFLTSTLRLKGDDNTRKPMQTDLIESSSTPGGLSGVGQLRVSQIIASSTSYNYSCMHE